MATFAKLLSTLSCFCMLRWTVQVPKEADSISNVSLAIYWKFGVIPPCWRAQIDEQKGNENATFWCFKL